MNLVAEIADRLKAECGASFRLIGMAGELAAVKERPTALPALYVYAIEDAAEENQRLNGHLQRVEADVGVLMVVSNLSDPKGGAAAGDIETLKTKTRAALAGWQPPSAEEPLGLVGGKLVKAAGGAVWWEDTIGAAFFIEG